MTTDPRYRLAPSNRGGLQVWQVPVQGREYVIGSDTAAGGPVGDYSVACVVDAETCALVAMWRDKMSPIPWGRAASRLGWYYEEALLAFETGPSAHGLAAAHASIAYGYRRLFKQQNIRRADMPQSEQLGWPTNQTTKPMMIARVQEALEQNVPIPSEELLREMTEQSWVESGTTRKMKCERNDDCVMAYAIALLVRDRAWTSGMMRPASKHVVMDESARFWAAREERQTRRQKQMRMRA